MALIRCKECRNAISAKALACPICGEPRKAGGMGIGTLVVVLILGVVVIGAINSPDSGNAGPTTSSAPQQDFSATDALGLCRYTIKGFTNDPEKADIPYVGNSGTGAEYRFAWGRSTKFMRMRNGLGLEVPVSASCAVDTTTRKITSLSIDGKDIITPNL